MSLQRSPRAFREVTENSKRVASAMLVQKMAKCSNCSALIGQRGEVGGFTSVFGSVSFWSKKRPSAIMPLTVIELELINSWNVSVPSSHR